MLDLRSWASRVALEGRTFSIWVESRVVWNRFVEPGLVCLAQRDTGAFDQGVFLVGRLFLPGSLLLKKGNNLTTAWLQTRGSLFA